MKRISLHFPILIRKTEIAGQMQYVVHPLLADTPRTWHRKYEEALSAFEAAVNRFFRDFSLTRNNADVLSPFLFTSDVHLHLLPLTLSIGKNHREGLFHFVVLHDQGKRIGCLPSFGYYMFEIDEKTASHPARMKETLSALVSKWMLTQSRESGQTTDWESLQAGKRDTIAWCDMDIVVGVTAFDFGEEAGNSSYAALFSSRTFKGENELYQVGYALDDGFPAGLQPAFYRHDLAGRVYRYLYGNERFSLVMVGPEGVGRHTLLHDAVLQYRQHLSQQPAYRRGSKLWLLDPGRVIAGMSIVGQWQQRMEAMIEFVRHPQSDDPDTADVMVFDNPIALIKIGRSAQNTLSISDLLKPYIEKKQLRVVLLATPEEWMMLQEKDRRFADLFKVIPVHPPDPDIALRIALMQRNHFEASGDILFSNAAIHYLFFLHRLYFSYQALPGGVIRLMHMLMSRFKSGAIDVSETRQVFLSLSGLREAVLEETEPFKEGQLQQEIAQQLIGQPHAVAVMSETVQLIKARLNEPERPLASLLLTGPTGVGKTQAAKILSAILMGSEAQLIRFDMNEYIDYRAADRLIGSFYQPEGQLTGRVRYQPFGVLLLDEIEKAHPRVLDMLLQVLDDARLTDSVGKTVDFSNLVIVMTSNVGSDKASGSLGFKGNASTHEDIYRKALENRFRPEFLNRIDEVVVFHPLRVEHMLDIARLQIRELLSRDGFVRRSTIVDIDPVVLEWVARRGYDPHMGGRALKRQIENDLTALSAKQLLKVPPGVPIILSVQLKDNHLLPSVLPLKMVSEGKTFFDAPPAGEKHMRKALYELLHSADRMLLEMDHDRPQSEEAVIADPAQWGYFDLKDKVISYREEIREYILRLGDKRELFAPGETLRLRKAVLPESGSVDPGEGPIFSQALPMWRDAFHYQPALWSADQSGLLDLQIRRLLLDIFVEGLMTGNPDHVEIGFRSRVHGMGQEQVAHQMQIFGRLLRDLDIHFELDKQRSVITAAGYGLRRLLSGEEGLALYYLADGTPVPIQVTVYEAGDPSDTADSFTLLRIFDSGQTAIDLRSGWMGRYELPPMEFRAFLYSAIQTDTVNQ